MARGATGPTAALLLAILLSMTPFFGPLQAAECSEICQAYLTCVEQAYPGDSTDAQKQTIIQGCMAGCAKKQETSNQCYIAADGKNGTVENCDTFSACILNSN